MNKSTPLTRDEIMSLIDDQIDEYNRGEMMSISESVGGLSTLKKIKTLIIQAECNHKNVRHCGSSKSTIRYSKCTDCGETVYY